MPIKKNCVCFSYNSTNFNTILLGGTNYCFRRLESLDFCGDF